MSVLRYVRLDVFTNQPFSGIQLAVFPDAAGIDERRMQRIANEMALPETTFVLPPEVPEAAARVRIFTPSRELPMAGSPTIGTVFALAGARRLRAGADKAVLGLGIGPTTVGLEWGQNALRLTRQATTSASGSTFCKDYRNIQERSTRILVGSKAT